MKIYNGEFNEDSKFGKYCGKTIPSSITSITNKVYIHFHSDSNYNFKGFKLEYQSISKYKNYCYQSNKTEKSNVG